MQLRPDSGGTDETGHTRPAWELREQDVTLPRGTLEGRRENLRRKKRPSGGGLNKNSLSRTEGDINYLDVVYR